MRLVNPATEQSFAIVQDSGVAEVEAAAQAALDGTVILTQMSLAERKDIVVSLRQVLEKNIDSLAAIISLQMGVPSKLSEGLQVRSALGAIDSMVEAISEETFIENVGSSQVIHEPIGPVAAITPWNYPLLQVVSKVMPAMLAGCGVVLKPSEYTPLDAIFLAEAVAQAGVPKGVFNLVLGSGHTVGETLITNKHIRMVSFTGSTAVGAHIAAVGAQSLKKVALELGGKSASIILPGAVTEEAVGDAVRSTFLNSGQTCSALTRLVVPREDLANVEELAASAASTLVVGDPARAEVDVGPVANRNQFQNVNELLERSAIDGARVSWQYPEDELPESGYYVAPRILVTDDPYSTIAQREIFGPVLTIIPYDGVDHAIEIANSTPYGLAGAVWGLDDESALEVAEQMETGTVAINGAPFDSQAPFGGVKQSGYGRELGKFGVLEFTTMKSMYLQKRGREE